MPAVRAVVTWQTAVRVLAPLGALYVEGWPALIGALLVQEGGLWLARHITASAQRQVASALFLAAYGLRMLIVLPTHYVAKLGNGSGALYRDDYTNDLVGDWLVRIARGEGATAIFPGHQYLLDSVYSYLLMGIYAVFGYAPLVPKLLNVGLAALCSVFTFEIARKIFSQRVAVLAALGTAFLPSLIVWSVATLKETLVLFVSLVALWALQIVGEADRRDRRIWDALVVLLATTLLLLDLRSTSAFIVIGLLGVFVVARSRVRPRGWQLGLAGVAIAALLVGGTLVARERTNNRPLTASFEDLALQIRHRRAQEAAGAASQLRPEDLTSDTSSQLPAAEASSDAAPFSFVGDVLDPLGYALLAPTPWQATSPLELAASAEMLVWYVLLVASVFSWKAGPRQPLFYFGLIVYGVANWLILAAVEGNVGNLLRHRMMLDPVLLILGAAGLEWLWLSLRARSGSAVQVTELPD
ncbi:MAG: glycosyltransferase family 39 protein [Chloroflexi bacterium]|nr:glycosyltransferase family 39 protein [Chloroflexota bacterium]